MGEQILGQIITLLYSGIEQSAEGLASGVEALVKGLMVVETTGTDGNVYSLTTFGTVVVIFARHPALLLEFLSYYLSGLCHLVHVTNLCWWMRYGMCSPTLMQL